jgi:hypothetical protein
MFEIPTTMGIGHDVDALPSLGKSWLVRTRPHIFLYQTSLPKFALIRQQCTS